MSLMNLHGFHGVLGTGPHFDISGWLKRAGRSLAAERQSADLNSLVVITGYLLIVAALAVVFLTGKFPWFMLMLVVSMPLYALMSDQD